jgi:hypothetical protein
MIMKTTVSALVALAVLTGFTDIASANTHHTQSRSEAYRNAPSRSHQFIAEKRPFGSASWWREMDREDRGGNR